MVNDPLRQAIEQQSLALSARVEAGKPLAADEVAQLELLSRLKTIRDGVLAWTVQG